MMKAFKLSLSKVMTPVALALAMVAGSFGAQADRLLTENFDYPAGDLYGQGGWLMYGKQAASPIQVIDGALSLDGYQPKAVGKAVKLGNVASAQDLMIKFADKPLTTGAYYVSALVNVKSVSNDAVFFMNFAGLKTFADKKTGSEMGRLFATKGADGKFNFKISRNSGTELEDAGEYDLNTTYLVVMKYEFVEGTKNDIVKVWINPTNQKAEPQAQAEIGASTQADIGRLNAIELRQGGSSSKTAPEVVIDGLRVANSWADLFDKQETGEPELTVTPNVQYKGEAIAMGDKITFATYKVDYSNLPTATQVYLTGKDAGQYEVSAAEIPAGSGSTKVTLYYKPNAIGKHQARINFESSVNILNTGFGAVAIAYDPNNLPTITPNASALEVFKCKVGETVKQTFTVTTANFPDYGKAAIKGDSHGAFVINNTSLLKQGKTSITVTFKPQAVGNYTETITLTGIKAEPKTVTLTGVATAAGGGEPTPDPEGDMLPLDDTNPYLTLDESFNTVTKNKAFKLKDWKNIAMQGTRAWWGYEWTDTENEAAKVTAYDSKIESGAGTPCQMMLITPALDYKNATNKVFSFRVRGDILKQGMTDKLEVCYVLKQGASYYAEPLEIDIPATPDRNKNWESLDVHLENQNIEDVFFMGFRFTSTRGSDNSAVYYIDDVKWNFSTTGVETVTTAKIAGKVQYVNLTGAVSNVPFDGVNIVEITYTDGTVSTYKMVK